MRRHCLTCKWEPEWMFVSPDRPLGRAGGCKAAQRFITSNAVYRVVGQDSCYTSEYAVSRPITDCPAWALKEGGE